MSFIEGVVIFFFGVVIANLLRYLLFFSAATLNFDVTTLALPLYGAQTALALLIAWLTRRWPAFAAGVIFGVLGMILFFLFLGGFAALGKWG